MKTENVPLWFGGMHGEIIGIGSIEITEKSNGDKHAIVSIDIDHKDAEHIGDLLSHQLMGFAMVIRPGNPTAMIDPGSTPLR